MILMNKKKVVTCVCLCAALTTIYITDNDAFGSTIASRILYTEDELKQMKDDFGCISRLHRLIYVHIPKTWVLSVKQDDTRSFNYAVQF